MSRILSYVKDNSTYKGNFSDPQNNNNNTKKVVYNSHNNSIGTIFIWAMIFVLKKFTS